MKLIELSAQNYKSYLTAQRASVEPGFNIFLGANNAGKTTLLEALDVDIHVQIPHRSIQNLPFYGMAADGNSKMGFAVAASLLEMRQPIDGHLSIPVQSNWQDVLDQEHMRRGVEYATNRFLAAYVNAELKVYVEFGGGQLETIYDTPFGKHRVLYNTQVPALLLRIMEDGTPQFVTVQGISAPSHLMGFSETLGRAKEAFYRFSANRRPAGRCGESPHPVSLAPDASNLPYCLNVLQSTDAHGHKILCEWTNRIFPAVQWVQANPRPSNQFEIECLPIAPSERRSDLAIPLEKMGSGIGNVIAMLYVVLTARVPRVIAIDEPNSFLHPKALRELLRIFSTEGAEHQYLLTAHSADVLNSIPPSLITTFDVINGATITQQFRGQELASIRGALSDLGIRMTDLHGRDQVLWVEGQTEELIMPELLKAFCPEISAGTAVLRVEHTSKFDKAGREVIEVVNAYERLTNSALVPPAVAILIDTEKRNAADCRKLERDTNGRLRFLPQTMLENYALHARAIVAVLNYAGELLSVEEVEELLFSELAQPYASDGAKVLKNVFNAATKARLEFRKTTHTPELFSWILREDPEHLSSLRVFLRELFRYKSNA